MSVLGPEHGFAADDAPRALRLALARSGRRLAALAWGRDDPVTLSRLGLHAQASAGFLSKPKLERRWPAAAVVSHFAAGALNDARRLGICGARRPSRRLALALAPLDPALALTSCPAREEALRLALGLQAQAVTRSPAPPCPESRLLMAWAENDGPALATAWADTFTTRGMTPITSRDPTKPVLLDNAMGSADPSGGELISVIMPVRNAARYVGSAVRSVLGQGWRDLEFLLVDDASTDDTVACALEAADDDSRMILIRQSQRAGPYVARNRALSRAKGRWVAFQDADEWAHPDRLRVQRQAMIDRGLVASVGRSVRIDADGRPRARGVWPLVRWAPSTLMLERVPVLSRAGLMHEVLSGADSEYWWRMAALFGPSRVANLAQLLILGAWREDSLTGSPESGYGTGGINLERLAYWEAWNLWHLAMSRMPDELKLDAGAQPFDVPQGLIVSEEASA